MTREEAIFILKRDNPNNIAIRSGFESLYNQRKEAFAMAIKALEQEAQTFEWCHDCSEYDQDKHYCPRFNKVIRNTVEETKQRKTGHWIPKTKYWWECSECGRMIYTQTESDKLKFHAFCGRCGAKMVESQESEN